VVVTSASFWWARNITSWRSTGMDAWRHRAGRRATSAAHFDDHAHGVACDCCRWPREASLAVGGGAPSYAPMALSLMGVLLAVAVMSLFVCRVHL